MSLKFLSVHEKTAPFYMSTRSNPPTGTQPALAHAHLHAPTGRDRQTLQSTPSMHDKGYNPPSHNVLGAVVA